MKDLECEVCGETLGQIESPKRAWFCDYCTELIVSFFPQILAGSSPNTYPEKVVDRAWEITLQAVRKCRTKL